MKDVGRLEAAYDDSAGVTAAFNRNVLPAQPGARRRLRPRRVRPRGPVRHRRTSGSRCGCGRRSRQSVHIAELDLTVRFAAGEEMRTEITAKFRPDGLEAELTGAGFALTNCGPTRPATSPCPCQSPNSSPRRAHRRDWRCVDDGRGGVRQVDEAALVFRGVQHRLADPRGWMRRPRGLRSESHRQLGDAVVLVRTTAYDVARNAALSEASNVCDCT